MEIYLAHEKDSSQSDHALIAALMVSTSSGELVRRFSEDLLKFSFAF